MKPVLYALATIAFFGLFALSTTIDPKLFWNERTIAICLSGAGVAFCVYKTAKTS